MSNEDMASRIQVYLKKVENIHVKRMKREKVKHLLKTLGLSAGEKRMPEKQVSDKGLKQGSLSETEKTTRKKEKKSIHERLKSNKEIIAKKQGKESKEKGVELV